jgi:ketosteroid isomerase-like protein
MKPIVLTIVVLTMAAFGSCHSASENTLSSPSTVENASADANPDGGIKKLSLEYDTAWVEQDAAAFERLLADDVIHVDPEGRVLSKTDIVANARSGALKFETGRSEGARIRVYGNTAIVSGLWIEKGTYKGKPFGGTSWGTVVFVKRNGRWKVVSDQVTPILSQAQNP